MKHLTTYITLFSALLMANLCSSCIDDDMPVVDLSADNEVRISATINDDSWSELSRTQKDAAGISVLSFEKDDEIEVDAWYLPAGANATSVLPDFMCDQKMKFDGEKWVYSPVKYWPNNKGDRLLFFAHYFPSAFTSYTVLDNDAETGYPTFMFTNHNYAYDLLATPIVIANKPEEGGVEMKFKHIMAYVNVKARVSTRDGSANAHSVWINEIWMHNTPRTATFKGFDSAGDPIWENVSIYQYTLATKGEYVKDKSDNFINVGAGNGCYSYDGNVYEKHDIGTHNLLESGKYQKCRKGYFIKDQNGNFIELADECGNYIKENNTYVEVDGPGMYCGSSLSLSSEQQVELPASGEYVDLPDFNHVMYPIKMLNYADQEIMSISVVISDKRHGSDNDIGGEYAGGGYGYEIQPNIEFKGGCLTTIYLTVGLHGIDNVEYDVRPYADWSGTKSDINASF